MGSGGARALAAARHGRRGQGIGGSAAWSAAPLEGSPDPVARARRRWRRAAEKQRVERSWQGGRWEPHKAMALWIWQTKVGGGPI